MNGILYGVGVGIGDPEMMTLKAVRILKESDIIYIPSSDREGSRAFRIAEAAVPGINDKEILGFDIEMSRDGKYLSRKYAEIYASIKENLSEGKIASYITIGDPSLYSSFSYIAGMAVKDGFDVRMVSGIDSFSACAATLNIPLCEGDSELHIIPGTADLERALLLPGTKVILKCGKNLPRIKENLIGLEKKMKSEGKGLSVFGVAECGTDEEKVYFGAEQLPEDNKYMITIIVRENR